MNGFGLYVHIPFCKKKCNYCDFLSFDNSDKNHINQYVDSLINYLGLKWQKHFPFSGSVTRPSYAGAQTCLAGRQADVAASSEYFCHPQSSNYGQRVSTIFIGGGTPTLLSKEQLEKIITSIFRNFKINTNAEFTIEANPGTIDFNKLKLLKDRGVNRLSIGVQSFNNKELDTLGRIHSNQEIYESFEAAQNAGFSNINLDLIFAIPGQSLESWKYTLKEAVKLNPTHISAYNLQLEEGTFFHKNKAAYNFLDDETELEMYKLTIEFLKANGYKHYEISNFAKPGFECKHNINYWENGDYLGIGLGASSHINGKRWQNSTDMNMYIYNAEITNQSLRGQSLTATCLPAGRTLLEFNNESVNIENEISETIFMGLRLIKGINLKEFENRFGISFLKKYEKEISELLVDKMIKIESGNLCLSGKGLYLANGVFERFV